MFFGGVRFLFLKKSLKTTNCCSRELSATGWVFLMIVFFKFDMHNEKNENGLHK